METLTDWEFRTLMAPLEKELKKTKSPDEKVALEKLKDKLIRIHLFGGK